jgi:hypothetical protein
MSDRFTLLAELGRGGMGEVWKARDEETGEVVALKVLRQALEGDPSFERRFQGELSMARRIESAHVVRVLGCGERQGAPWVAFELVDGSTLQSLMIRHGPYGWAEARGILLQLAEGLADAHAAGVIHGDLKPSNVLVDRQGTCKLADFGVARAADLARADDATRVLGSPAYLAPEGPVDTRSDLYSLGVIGYEMLSGQQPFAGNTYQELMRAHLSKLPDLSVLPPEARPIIGWLLAKDRAERPETAWSLIRVLNGDQPVPAALGVVAGDARSPGTAAIAAAPRVHAPVAPTPLSRDMAIRVAALVGAVAILATALGAGVTIALQGSGEPAMSPTVQPVLPTVAAIATPIKTTALPTPAPSASRRPAGSGSWYGVDPLPQPLWGQAGVLLRDGRFMVIGGSTGTWAKGATAAVWFYDSTTRRWASGPSMPHARVEPMATLLNDGSVLVVGGGAGGVPLAVAERFVPDSGRWEPVASMHSARTEGTITTLKDGRVLVTGGGYRGAPSYAATASAEVYDPSTGSWTVTPNMSAVRVRQTATLLADGRVLVAGGGTSFSSPRAGVSSSVDLFDPATGLFQPASPMPAGLYSHAAALLADGRVLVTGGWSSASNRAPSRVLTLAYDPATGQWSKLASMALARAKHEMAVLPDGTVLVAGGLDTKYAPMNTAEVYDPDSDAWTTTANIPAACYWSALGVLADGSVLIAGGRTQASKAGATNAAALYIP